MSPLNRWLGTLAAWWGVFGTVVVLAYAIMHLLPVALEAFTSSLNFLHWTALIMNTVFMAYSEGYRGFSCSFSPRVAERASRLRMRPTWLRGVLAPLYCVGYFDAPWRVKSTVYALTIGIVILVQLVHFLEQPWRGILDAGVIVGLLWGTCATLIAAIRALHGPSTTPTYEPTKPSNDRSNS